MPRPALLQPVHSLPSGLHPAARAAPVRAQEQGTQRAPSPRWEEDKSPLPGPPRAGAGERRDNRGGALQ